MTPTTLPTAAALIEPHDRLEAAVTTLSAATIIALHERVHDAADTLTQVAKDLVGCVPSKPEAPLSEIGIEISDSRRAQLQAALSRCTDAIDAVRKALDQNGGGRAA